MSCASSDLPDLMSQTKNGYNNS